jgi:hypothetical protein
MTTPTWAERELLSSLKPELDAGLISVVHDVGDILSALDSRFPFAGNRLDWSHVPDAVVADGPDTAEPSLGFQRFVRAQAAREGISGDVVVVGDNQVRFVVGGEISVVLGVLPRIIAFPQHTYIYPFPEVTWCANRTFEGDFYFGFAPSTLA